MHSPTWNTHGRKLWTSSQWVMFSKCKSIKDAFLRPNDASPVTWKSYLCVYYRPCWSSGCLTLEVCVKSLPSPSLSASVRDPHLPETRRHRWHTHTPSCTLSRRFITDVCPLLPSSRRHLLLRAAGGGVKGWSFYNAMRQQMGLSIMRCVCVCDFAACWEKTQMFSGFVVGVKAGTHPGRRSGRSSERLPVHHRADLFN